MQKSKIEWCTMTWNPVTGCLHGCDYCYARGIANRFKSRKNEWKCVSFGNTHWLNGIEMPILDSPVMFQDNTGAETSACAFPAGFNPTFHRYRLEEPATYKKPQNIFVCSMADLFGEWVPDEWILEVLKTCSAASQHNFMFLTKNPMKYRSIDREVTKGNNLWFGTSISGTTKQECLKMEDFLTHFLHSCNRFLSIEPLMFPVDLKRVDMRDGQVLYNCLTGSWSSLGYAEKNTYPKIKWVIVGAETGPGSAARQPRREWVQSIVDQCQAAGVPIFLKNNLASIWGGELIQEMPEGLRRR